MTAHKRSSRPVCLISARSRRHEGRLAALFEALGYAVVTPHRGEEKPAHPRVVCAEVEGPSSSGYRLLEAAAEAVPESLRIAVGGDGDGSWLARAADAGIVQLVFDLRRADRDLTTFLRGTPVTA